MKDVISNVMLLVMFDAFLFASKSWFNIHICICICLCLLVLELYAEKGEAKRAAPIGFVFKKEKIKSGGGNGDFNGFNRPKSGV